MKKCIHCGYELEDIAIFCSECGKSQEVHKDTPDSKIDVIDKRERKNANDYVNKNTIDTVNVAMLEDMLSRDLKSNTFSEKYAESIIAEGFDEALRKFKLKSDTQDKVALAKVLIEDAQKRGDTDTILDIVTDLAICRTLDERTTQAFNMLRATGSAGQALYLEKWVQRRNKELRSKWRDKRSTWAKEDNPLVPRNVQGYKTGYNEFKPLVLNRELMQRLVNATDEEEITELSTKIMADLALQENKLYKNRNRIFQIILSIIAIIVVECVGNTSSYNNLLYSILTVSYIIMAIVSIIIVLYFLKSILQSILIKENIRYYLFSNFSGSFNLLTHYKKYTVFISVLLIVFNIQYTIVYSGISSQIGSILEAPTFTARYEAIVTCENKGDMPKYEKELLKLNSLNDSKVEVIVDKTADIIDTKVYQDYLGIDREVEAYDIGYYITAIEIGKYTLILDNSQPERTNFNRTISVTPVEIYKDNNSCDIENMPTYRVTLKDHLLENLSYKGIDIFKLLPLTVYILFILSYLIYNIYSSKNIKSITKKIIATVTISAILIVFPVVYISLPSVFGHTNYTSIINTNSNEYYLNQVDKIIHYKDCPVLDPRGIYAESTDYNRAIENGYTPCGMCNP